MDQEDLGRRIVGGAPPVPHPLRAEQQPAGVIETAVAKDAEQEPPRFPEAGRLDRHYAGDATHEWRVTVGLRSRASTTPGV
jgi:hypothetical protein